MFKSGHVLYAAELNTLVGRINSIINDVVNIQTNDNGVTYDQVEDAIDAYYRSIIQGAINQLNSNLGNALRRLTNLEKGSGHEEGENYDLQWLRNDIGAIFRYMGITKDEETGIYTYALDMGSLADIDNIGQAIAALQTSASTNGDAIAGLTAGIIASYDEFGNPIYKFDPAQIILAINSSGDTIGKIKADYIELDGYVKASDIDAQNITAKSLLAKGDSEYPRIVINSTDGIQLLTSASASAININMDGSGSLANGNITWDTQGNLTINGTFKVGAKYIEYIYDNSVTANVSFSDTQAGLQANVTVTNTNNFDVYCNVQWYADGTNNIWSASGVTDIIRVAANSSRTIEDGISAQDIQGYSSATHPSIDTNNAGADLVNIYHYIDRNS